jgi:hypothetical protein
MCKQMEVGVNLEQLQFLGKVQISSMDGERLIWCCCQIWNNHNDMIVLSL